MDGEAPINAGFMILKSVIFHYPKDDSTVFERAPLELLVVKCELMSYMYKGFLKCINYTLFAQSVGRCRREVQF